MLTLWSTSIQRESSATIKTAPVPYELGTPAKAKNLVQIDCRGLEFTDFKPDVGFNPSQGFSSPSYQSQGEWEATGVDSGTKFSGIDLSEGEWFDYDEKASAEVSIKDIKWEIRRA